MITIVNYGLGNVAAFCNIFRRLDIPVRVASCANELAGAEKLILPGVGAFDWAIERLGASGMRGLLDQLVIEGKIPVLGVCVGMQMMANKSEEGHLHGLGWVPGDVRLFAKSRFSAPMPLPHMGWNDVSATENGSLFEGLDAEARFYFLHSYYFEVEDPAHIAANADYGGTFCCAIRHQNIYGVQFHPEKSHNAGVRLLKNFAEV